MGLWGIPFQLFWGRPTIVGKPARGASSPAKPAFTIKLPLSTTRVCASSSQYVRVSIQRSWCCTVKGERTSQKRHIFSSSYLTVPLFLGTTSDFTIFRLNMKCISECLDESLSPKSESSYAHLWSPSRRKFNLFRFSEALRAANLLPLLYFCMDSLVPHFSNFHSNSKILLANGPWISQDFRKLFERIGHRALSYS